ncbi:uncharacterized protein LOC113522004 [Galleria mellonella]|uniref:Uncharacterized protein LOC113522004 n=1 Tax=Galleria mellonella TaxID=7137 RepID=A0A6J1X264_GALME|nr:uncharacterized protein LOC113522004 [Galleria mellonella]
MNLPEIKSYEDQAIDTVVSVINRAKEKLGIRQTLRQLAQSRDILASQAKLPLYSLRSPLAVTAQKLLADAIEKKWRLTDTLMYTLKYVDDSKDESSHFYYFEAVFSQPTASYPIPQATASVFFRVEEKHIEPVELKGVPMMTFRIEGQRSDHDVRYVALTADWILAVIQMKIKLFRRIEGFRLF